MATTIVDIIVSANITLVGVIVTIPLPLSTIRLAVMIILLRLR
jgi:hypothetical protein